MRRLGRPGHRPELLRGSIVGLFALLLLVPGLLPPADATAATVAPRALGATVEATVFVHGSPTDGATSPASAVPVSLAAPFNVTFRWAAVGIAGLPQFATIGAAKLDLYLFGAVISGREVTVTNPVPSPGGNLSTQADFTYARYLVAGVYLMGASLLDPNGSTVWSGTFYLRITAPYDLTIVSALAGLLIAFELYSLARLGGARTVERLKRRERAADGREE